MAIEKTDETTRDDTPTPVAVSRSASCSSNLRTREFSQSVRKQKETRFPYFGLTFASDLVQNCSDVINDHLAYLEYKRAGEYWKKTPKTDYTYSKLSPHRRILAPGVVAMPNMSRQGLENHNERINFLVKRDSDEEKFIRRRYQSMNITEQFNVTEGLLTNSADELDYTKHTYLKTNRQTWFIRIITKFVSILTIFWNTLTCTSSETVKLCESTTNGSASFRKNQGFLASLFYFTTEALSRLARYVYFFISCILVLDTWLLKSYKAGNKSKSRFFYFLALSSLLAAMSAWALSNENDRINILQRTQALVPFSLLEPVKSRLGNSAAFIKNHFQSALHYYDSANLNTFNENDIHKTSLNPEEIDVILNHMEHLVDSKIQEHKQQYEMSNSKITAEQSQQIVQFVNEHFKNLVNMGHFISTNEVKFTDLTEDDIQHLIERICQRFRNNGLPICDQALCTEHCAEKKGRVQRILDSRHLKTYVNARINSAIEAKFLNAPTTSPDIAAQQHELAVIKDLCNEIASIKLTLSDSLLKIESLQQSINSLNLVEVSLLSRIRDNEQSTEKRMQTLLNEVLSKLDDTNDDRFKVLNQQIKLNIAEILGFNHASSDDAIVQNSDLQRWLRSMFLTKEYLEQSILKLRIETNYIIKKEIDHSVKVLTYDITERLKRELTSDKKSEQTRTSDLLAKQISSSISEEEILKIVKSVLDTYDADKTGLVDFALESAGGQILSTRCTENYQTKSAQISVFGIPLWYPTNTPRVAISPQVQPGECWAFQGFPGYLVLKLNSVVHISGFTLEHIPKTLSPNGKIDSAPRNFTVWGLIHEQDHEPILFGEYEYIDSGATLQNFPVQNTYISRPYEIVELRIESNHGHPNYTCLYRFRVHGTSAS